MKMNRDLRKARAEIESEFFEEVCISPKIETPFPLFQVYAGEWPNPKPICVVRAKGYKECEEAVLGYASAGLLGEGISDTDISIGDAEEIVEPDYEVKNYYLVKL